MRFRPVLRRVLAVLVGLIAAYVLAAYVILPAAWTHHERQPGLAGLPMVTRTSLGIPGDPLNVGVVGSHKEVVDAIHAIGWHAADPITLSTSIGIIGSVIFDREYLKAPVSDLYYAGRKQDLAFEAPAGRSANRRHHVRFWRVLLEGAEGRPVWLGSATFDTGSGFSRYTGQITHHISADIDEERDFFIAALTKAGMLDAIYSVTGIGPTINGHNGGGDRYFTDGEIDIGVINRGAIASADLPDLYPSPLPVALKDRLFDAIGELID
jgi:hypothetical protein